MHRTVLLACLLWLAAVACGGSASMHPTSTPLRLSPTPAATIGAPDGVKQNYSAIPSSKTPVTFRPPSAAPAPPCGDCSVFQSYRSTIAADAATGAVQEIFRGPEDPTPPHYIYLNEFVWSPDGTAFAFPCLEDATWAEQAVKDHLCIWGRDGVSTPPVVRPEDLVSPGQIFVQAWSGDGRRLAFSVGGEPLSVAPDLYVLDIASGKSMLAAAGSPYNAWGRVRWSPDGARIAVVAATDRNLMTGQLLVVTPGSEPDVITQSLPTTVKGEPTGVWGDYGWSPDGSSVAFARNEHGTAPALYAASVADGSIRRLGEYGAFVAWSPDGRWLLTEADRCIYGHASHTCPRASAVRADGARVRDFGFAVSHDPAWSPDSKRVAFLGYERNEATPTPRDGLFVSDVDGGPPRPLQATQSFGFPPLISWSKSGGQIFYTEHGFCGQGGCDAGPLFLVDADGSNAARRVYDGPVNRVLDPYE